MRAAGVDAFLTADLRHHPASEAPRRRSRPALLDAAHWATEWPWCEQAAAQLDGSPTARLGVAHAACPTGHRPVDRARRRTRPLDALRSPQLNAEPADQLRLLDLQALDTTPRAARPQAHVAARARRAGVARPGPLAAARTSWSRAQTEASDTAREQTKAEQDVDQVRQRAVRDQQRLDSGTGHLGPDLESLQHEIVSLAKRQGDLEDVVLEVMEQPGDRAGACSTADRAGRRRPGRACADATARRDAATAEIDSEAPRSPRSARSLAADLPADLITLYDKIRAQQRRGRRARAATSAAAAAAGWSSPAPRCPDQGRRPGRGGPLRGLPADPGPYHRVGPVTRAEVVVEADGGSRGNPGPAGYGAVVLDPETGEVLAERAEYDRRGDQQRRRVPGPDRRAEGRAPSSTPTLEVGSGWTPSSSSSRCRAAGRSSTPDMKPLAGRGRARSCRPAR